MPYNPVLAQIKDLSPRLVARNVSLLLMIYFIGSTVMRYPSPTNNQQFPNTSLLTPAQQRINTLPANQPVAIYVWASWCATCKREIGQVEKSAKQADIELRTIAVKSVTDDVIQIVDDLGLQSLVLMDHDNLIYDQLDITGVPWLYMVDSTGVIKQRLAGGVSSKTMLAVFEGG